MGMGISQDRHGTTVMIAVVAFFVCIIAYEVYVYGSHTGTAYTKLFVKAQEDLGGSYLRIVTRGARPRKVTTRGGNEDISEGLSYREQRGIGQAVVKVDVPSAVDFYFSGRRGSQVEVYAYLTCDGQNESSCNVKLNFTHSLFERLRPTRSGLIRVQITPENRIIVVSGDGVSLAGKQAGMQPLQPGKLE